ncbi:DUF2244 domain-containing protein [Roseococcus sp. SYP-B2431]|uniref:DUF2244 domain-containing protein n=1 Tax=Roseococcus sp. SYP-B2431 TaxID=2496640 RepID=UPI00103C0A55|nr:DUF2244 domain-containing protein [Roseococcus sp. SYP-B2431]TCH97944.1 DUF2244 domain-containing protein [Roseococcus sp. SYP-B2431]
MPESPTLFEARSAPLASLDARGFRMLAGLLLLGFTFSGTVVMLMGAWPVTAFAGAETALVIGLLALYRAWARGSGETVTLTEGRLTVRRCEGRRREEASFDPFWARLRWQGARLFIRQRRDVIEIGRFLAPEEREDLARVLEAVLRRYREPVFDNPQLRG